MSRIGFASQLAESTKEAPRIERITELVSL